MTSARKDGAEHEHRILGNQQYDPAVEAVGHHSREQPEHHRRQGPRRHDQSEVYSRAPAQLQHEQRPGHCVDPQRTRVRDLTEPQIGEVPVREGGESGPHQRTAAAGRQGGWRVG